MRRANPSSIQQPAPRGMWFETRGGRRPFVLRWRGAGGAKKSASFESAQARAAYARKLATERAVQGRAANTPSNKELRQWDAFREITHGANPIEVARFWAETHGLSKPRMRRGQMSLDLGPAIVPVNPAAASTTAARETEPCRPC